MAVCALVLLLAAATGTAQRNGTAPSAPPAPPALTEELQVTSVDLWVGIDRGRLGAWLRGDDAGPKLVPTDLELRVAGQPVEIAVIEQVSIEREPPRVVVFLDAVLGDQASVRWSATQLAARAGDLTAVGEVEVVIADPDARVVVAATRDTERLQSALSSLALFAGTEAAIPLLRDEFLELADDDGAVELASAFVDEEIALVLRRQDLLLRWLVDGAAGAGRDAPERSGGVLLYVSQGFDPRPERFYLDTPEEEGRLERETTTWVRALAAYGWTCVPMVYEDRRALLRRGFRIGKWRFSGPSGKIGGPLVLLRAAHEAARDAEKAEALVELGDTLLAAGDDERARDSYLRAIHHFYGDPRTQSRQAYAWRQLALALRRMGEVDPARRALANAIELDPALAGAAELERETASLAQGVEGLDALASETGGHLLRGGEDLIAALTEIGRRQRLSFTLRGTPSGQLLTVEVAAKGRATALRYARWTRSGAPERVAAARLRLFLEAAAAEPAVDGAASLRVGAAAADPADESPATLALPTLDESRPARVLVGTLGEETPPRVTVFARDLPASASAPARWHGVVDAGEDLVAAAVYTEDLASGAWDAELVSVAHE